MNTDERQLDSFSLAQRVRALEQIASSSAQMFPAPQPGRELFNMHMHSFFSYNFNGYSPSRIAWESRKAGLYAAGLCDFDVLDGLDEFFNAGLMLELRTTVHLETRSFFSAYADVDINSPGEPGVAYIMGSGFGNMPEPGTSQAAGLALLREGAKERNRGLVRRINSCLPEIALDYEKDVAPLSPGACPTERHIVRAYRLKAESVFADSARLFDFWSGLMNIEASALMNLYSDIPLIEEKLRALLVKSGGIGYERPNEHTFPPIAEFIKWTLSCEAMPTIAWLDGTSEGEKDTVELFKRMLDMGACALNIIPDRNHNISDPVVRRRKLDKLDEVILAARRLGLPINIGTEMNKAGQPFADDTRCKALRAYHADFLKGARIMVGQALLSRFAHYSYVGAGAEADFEDDIAEKNRFFESVGALPPLDAGVGNRLRAMPSGSALDVIRSSADARRWTIG